MLIDHVAALMPLTTARSAAALGWKLDQLLTAQVIGTTANNYSRLRIGNQVVDAQTRIPLETGRHLSLKVIATRPTVVLEVQVPQAGTKSAPGNIERGLARNLPRQGTLIDTLTLLRQLHRYTAGPVHTPPGSVRTASRPASLPAVLSGLIDSFPRTGDLVAGPALRAALLHAATPLEAKLDAASAPAANPQARAAVAADMRAQLAAIDRTLRAQVPAGQQGAFTASRTGAAPSDTAARVVAHDPQRRQLPPGNAAADQSQRPSWTDSGEPSPARIRELLDGTIARIHTQQLGNVPGTATHAPLIVDLPVLHRERVDMWHFEFDHDQAADHPHEPARAIDVSLTLQLDQSHAVHAQLRFAGNTLSVRLDTDDARLRTLIGTRAPELEHRIARHGIEVARIAIAELSAESRPRTRARSLIDDTI